MDPEILADILTEIAEMRGANLGSSPRPDINLLDPKSQGGVKPKPGNPLGTTPTRMDLGGEVQGPKKPPSTAAQRAARKKFAKGSPAAKIVRNLRLLKGGGASLGIMALYKALSELSGGNERNQFAQLQAIQQRMQDQEALTSTNPLLEMQDLAGELEMVADASERVATISPMVRELAKSGIPARSIQELIQTGGFS